MPVNHYFQGGNGIGSTEEKRLYENLIIEGLKIYGHDVYYLPRTLVNRDLILGEDVASKFNAAYLAEMYFDTTEGFAGEQEIINKFGLEIREDTSFTISKRRWNDLVDDPGTMIVSGRPNEGDIIYMPLMNSFFEIQFVEDQEPFFQLGNLPVYKLKVTRWEYSSERIDTGVSGIDAAEDKYTLDQLQHQNSLETGTFTAIGTATVSSETISAISITNAGHYTATPTITISDPPDSTGVLHGSYFSDFYLSGAGGSVTGSIGSGYTAGTYNLTGGSGSGAQLTVTSSTGAITGLTSGLSIAAGGQNYQVGDVLLIDGGDQNAYIKVGTVTTASNTTATATATLTGTGVSSVSITNAGTGYTSTPTVTFSSSSESSGSILLENDSVDNESNYFLLETYNLQTQSPYADNNDLDSEAGFDTSSTADDILDFTERNPFGDLDNGL